MDTSEHNLCLLFKQLGLPSSKTDVYAFIEKNQLDQITHLPEANCWSETQSQFLTEAIAMDSDWSGVVDLLDTLMREKNKL